MEKERNSASNLNRLSGHHLLIFQGEVGLGDPRIYDRCMASFSNFSWVFKGNDLLMVLLISEIIDTRAGLFESRLTLTQD